MLFTDVQRSVRLNKKKKSTNTSPYPDEVIDRLARAFYPAILACWNSEEGQRSLVGARPLHLLSQTVLPLKSPTGAFIAALRFANASLPWQAEQAHHANNVKQEVPSDGELPAVHIAIVCGLWQGASGWTHPVFVLPLIF